MKTEHLLNIKPEAILTTKNLVAGYGTIKVLHGISVQFFSGHFTAMIGSNGSGISTLFKAIAGIIPTMSGTIIFKGKKLTCSQEMRYKKGICFIPERKAIFLHLTVRENLELIGGKKGDYEEVFTLFPDLKKRWNLSAWKLSGGQKQMIALSQAILSDRKLILIDNPTGGLYKSVAENLLIYLKELAKRKNSAIVIKARGKKIVENIADSFYFLDAGKVIKGGGNVSKTTKAFYSS